MNRRKFLKTVGLATGAISLPIIKASAEKDEYQEIVCKGVTEDFYAEQKEKEEWDKYRIEVFYTKENETFVRASDYPYNINFFESETAGYTSLETYIRKNNQISFVKSGLDITCETRKEDKNLVIDINPKRKEYTREQCRIIGASNDNRYLSDYFTSIVSIRTEVPEKSGKIAEIEFSAKRVGNVLRAKDIRGEETSDNGEKMGFIRLPINKEKKYFEYNLI